VNFLRQRAACAAQSGDRTLGESYSKAKSGTGQTASFKRSSYSYGFDASALKIPASRSMNSGPAQYRGRRSETLRHPSGQKRPATIAVVASDELPNLPHLELDMIGHFALAKIKETVLVFTGG
jgi:hypothetical protein